MQAADQPGVLAEVASILGNRGISIEAVVQKEPLPDAKFVPLILLTHSVKERQMNEAISEIEALDAVTGKVTRIRVEHLNA